MQPLVSHSRRAWLYLLALVVVLFLVLPVLIVVPMSFSDSRMLDFPPRGWSLRWYERFFTAMEWSGALVVSLKVAACTVLLATPVGVAAAYGIHCGRKAAVGPLQTLLLLPLMVPHIVVAVGIFYVFVKLEILGSFFGLVLAHTMLALPFVVVTVLAGLRSYDMAQEMVARSLGCTRLRAFLTVTLPQIRVSVLSGALFAFVTSLDEVVVSLFIAAGDNATITKVMFGSLRDEIDPTIATVSTLLILCSLLVVVLSAVLSRRPVPER
ncbi:Inner membrane ABC transporter permease protein YdcV [Variovorax sp. PBS-H4]|uniref:ABC transporter permease n=1 Tax=Variovorax sp. PBS-H4 TaxID=434008 RepID=UPI00131631E7|nr:ABC transporter permease [Variovorax sp. PBS-H4]VTU28721.1 Inner membrane ABC transporter permease protein YdcV [Variovorax sp. PBS-H4]